MENICQRQSSLKKIPVWWSIIINQPKDLCVLLMKGTSPSSQPLWTSWEWSTNGADLVWAYKKAFLGLWKAASIKKAHFSYPQFFFHRAIKRKIQATFCYPMHWKNEYEPQILKNRQFCHISLFSFVIVFLWVKFGCIRRCRDRLVGSCYRQLHALIELLQPYHLTPVNNREDSSTTTGILKNPFSFFLYHLHECYTIVKQRMHDIF